MNIEQLVCELQDGAGKAMTTAQRIYSIIRNVGVGETSADDALHCMIEDYKRMYDLGKFLDNLAEDVKKKGVGK